MWPAIIAAAASAVPALMQSSDNSQSRQMNRRQLEMQERNAKFQRLLSLIGTTQGMQQNMGDGQRLLSLRNSGA